MWMYHNSLGKWVKPKGSICHILYYFFSRTCLISSNVPIQGMMEPVWFNCVVPHNYIHLPTFSRAKLQMFKFNFTIKKNIPLSVWLIQIFPFQNKVKLQRLISSDIFDLTWPLFQVMLLAHVFQNELLIKESIEPSEKLCHQKCISDPTQSSGFPNSSIPLNLVCSQTNDTSSACQNMQGFLTNLYL